MTLKKNSCMALLMAAAALAGAAACGRAESKTTEAAPAQHGPHVAFCADSAYAYVAAQTAFGPRVPGTPAAEACGDWLVAKLHEIGAQNIEQQRATVEAYNGHKLPIRNISAQIDTANPRRVLLLAHWDSRPWADQEPDPARRNAPIDGANDGASGVGVILEIARNVAMHPAKMGLDILFVDAEDYGRRADDESQAALSNDNSWCLGTQHWLRQPTLPLQPIEYAVLLDMVGGRGALFPREWHSQYACPQIVDKLISAARRAGVADRFPDRLGGAVIDDHVYLIQAGIPAIDVIESLNPDTESFNPSWHTHADNLSNIDPESLRAAGLAVSHMLY